MARILVVGSVNIDRIWRLNAPVREGARISYQRIETRYGGGGYYTGRTLLALGHDVRLLTRLANDESGRQCRMMLEQAGFDTELVTMIDDETRPFDILVDPSGERTILFSGRGRRAPIAEIPTADADIVYLNVQRIDAAAGETLAARHDVIAQFPLAVDERRPAHILLASRSDILLEDRDALFAAAQSRAGKAVRALVLTNGVAPVRIIGAGVETRAPVPICAPVVDTIGAGDVFAGGFIDAYVRGRTIAEAARNGSDVAVRFLSNRTVCATRDADRFHVGDLRLT
jgi:sugar/nucleoside kinase (ribokinase family)